MSAGKQRESAIQAPPPQPTFTPTVTRYGGKDIAKSYKDGDMIVNEYIQTPEEKAQEEWRKSQIAQYEPKINVFDPSLVQDWQNKAKATQERTLQSFEDLYKPIERNTRNDYFSRLGTLDSTSYLDRVKDLEKNRQQTYADLARQAILDEDLYKQNELAQRYQYLNYLTGGVNNASESQFRLANSAYDNAMNASNMMNNYSLQRYNALANLYGMQLQNDAARAAKAAAERGQAYMALGTAMGGG